jgi:photosystem II stability/assembly factor-like uncharacterized protein
LQTFVFFLLVTQIFFAACFTVNEQGGWFWQNPLPQGNPLTSVKFISSEVGWAVGEGGIILKTTNGEQSGLYNQTNRIHFESVSFANENNGCAVGKVIWNDSMGLNSSWDNRLTTNGGTTWTEQSDQIFVWCLLCRC